MKISRKMDALVRFFKQVVSDPKLGMRTRMEAAKRLDSIYERAELLHEKAAARKERYEARATAQRTQEGGIPAPESPLEMNETETMDAVFGSILNGKGKDKADAHAD